MLLALTHKINNPIDIKNMINYYKTHNKIGYKGAKVLSELVKIDNLSNSINLSNII